MSCEPCPSCGKDNFGYFMDGEGVYRFTQCHCPLPTMEQIAINAGMHPEHKTKEQRAMCTKPDA